MGPRGLLRGASRRVSRRVGDNKKCVVVSCREMKKRFVGVVTFLVCGVVCGEGCGDWVRELKGLWMIMRWSTVMSQVSAPLPDVHTFITKCNHFVTIVHTVFR